MAVVSKPTIKATFETGDRPTQQEFEDFIDTVVPIASDGAVGFMEVISTASSIARPAETLTAIATAVQGGKLGIIEVLATADVTTHSSGVVGLQVLSAATTASARGHIDLVPGAVGLEVFEAVTTASAVGHLGIVTASDTVFGIIETATSAEAETATAVDRAMTPATMSSFMVLDTEQATTSGTAFDFTSIRAGVKRITIMFQGVSLSGTDSFLVQIGPVGGIETSGYISTGAQDGAAASSTSGFIIRGTNAAEILSGHMVLTLSDSANNTWISSHTGKKSTTGAVWGGGDKSLADVLTQVRLTRTGTNTFDLGAVNVLIE